MTSNCVSRAAVTVARALPESLRHSLAHSRLTRALTRAAYEALIGTGPDEVVSLPQLGGLRMRIDTRSFKGYVLGTHEPCVVNAIRQHVIPGQSVVDIGAHLGYFTLLMASRVGEHGQVYAFEPSERLSPVLQANIEMNALTPRVRIERLAVSDQTGQVQLWGRENDLNAVRSMISSSPLAVPLGEPADVETVASVRLDDYFSERGLVGVDFLKIDVEGAEGLVLRGAAGILKSFHPVVLVEMHTFAGSTHEVAADILQSHGYVLTTIDKEYGETAYHCLAIYIGSA